MNDKLRNNFNKVFNYSTNNLYFSPGRVNLIGEHIDYNGGFVMPSAISYGTYGAVGIRKDLLVNIYSEGFTNEVYQFDINNFTKNNDWADYIKGVFHILIEEGYQINQGIDLYINTTMPTNAGLSSSASLELLVIYILNDLFNLNIDKVKMSLLGKKVENDYVLVNSGIMDQFSVIMGRENHALLLNTDTLDYSYIPLNLNDYQLIIINTNKKRGLADSKYNERFSETRESLKILKETYDIENLCELNEEELPKIENLLPNNLYKRTKHVITEQQRTIKSAKALKENNLKAFATYLNESHESLKEDYDVTGIELDTLTELAIKHGAIGARMTGAGFGGCIISLVNKDIIQGFSNNVELEYFNKIKIKPSFYVVDPSDGTKKI